MYKNLQIILNKHSICNDFHYEHFMVLYKVHVCILCLKFLLCLPSVCIEITQIESGFLQM